MYELAQYVVETEYPYLNSLESGRLTKKLIKDFKEAIAVMSPEQKILDFLKHRNPSIQDELSFNLMGIAQKRNPKLAAELNRFRQNPQMSSRVFNELLNFAMTLPEGKRAIRLAYNKALKLSKERYQPSSKNTAVR